MELSTGTLLYTRTMWSIISDLANPVATVWHAVCHTATSVVFSVSHSDLIAVIIIFAVAGIVMCCSCVWIFLIEKVFVENEGISCCGFCYCTSVTLEFCGIQRLCQSCSLCGSRRNRRRYRPVGWNEINDFNGGDGRRAETGIPNPGSTDEKRVKEDPDSDIDVLLQMDDSDNVPDDGSDDGSDDRSDDKSENESDGNSSNDDESDNDATSISSNGNEEHNV